MIKKKLTKKTNIATDTDNSLNLMVEIYIYNAINRLVKRPQRREIYGGERKIKEDKKSVKQQNFKDLPRTRRHF